MRSKHFANPSIAPCSCDWVQARLFGYLDGELPLPERERFQAHTETCAACAREVQDARRADLALNQAIRAVPAAGDLRSGFYAKLAQSDAKSRAPRRWGWAVAVPAFAACAIAVVLMRPTATVSNFKSTLNIEKPIASVPSPAETKTGEDSVINESLSRGAAPPRTVAKTAPLRDESLGLVNAEMPIRLTKQELRRASQLTIARAEVPAISLSRVLTTEARQRDHSLYSFDSALDETKDRAFKEEKSFAAALPLRFETATTKLQEAESALMTINAPAESGEQNQNVMRVASLEQMETDGESYLEVDDDTRNFSFSTRLASSQENGEEEIELSISSDDDPEEISDGADSEAR